jgi:nicotinic acid mononucleotide adenylyltransferase
MRRSFYFSEHTLQHMSRVQALLHALHPEDEPMAVLVPGSPQPRHGVIVFPGSFNPPTTAHLALLMQARRFAEQKKGRALDLYAAFSKRTVDKERVERPLLLDRIVLLEGVLRRRVPHTGILLFNRGLYVEEAQGIRASFPHVKHCFFLMGFDKIVQILDKRYYTDRDASLTELFQLAELLVAPRGEGGRDELMALLHHPENERFAQYIHLLPLADSYRNISSTHIRQEEDGMGHDIPQEVRQFMRETRAYAPPLHFSDGTELDYYEMRVKALEQLLGAVL